jgi:hypothetical protein
MVLPRTSIANDQMNPHFMLKNDRTRQALIGRTTLVSGQAHAQANHVAIGRTETLT